MARRPLRRTTGNGKKTGGVNGGRETHACCQGRKVTPHMPPRPPPLRHEAGELAVELSLSHPRTRDMADSPMDWLASPDFPLLLPHSFEKTDSDPTPAGYTSPPKARR
jgi:hypothetical protein